MEHNFGIMLYFSGVTIRGIMLECSSIIYLTLTLRASDCCYPIKHSTRTSKVVSHAGRHKTTDVTLLSNSMLKTFGAPSIPVDGFQTEKGTRLSS